MPSSLPAGLKSMLLCLPQLFFGRRCTFGWSPRPLLTYSMASLSSTGARSYPSAFLSLAWKHPARRAGLTMPTSQLVLKSGARPLLLRYGVAASTVSFGAYI